jgi:hypothetical protein
MYDGQGALHHRLDNDEGATNKAEVSAHAEHGVFDAAELLEQRAGAKGNANEQGTHRTQGRSDEDDPSPTAIFVNRSPKAIFYLRLPPARPATLQHP